MREFICIIGMDNAAFDEPHAQAELVLCLTKVAARIPTDPSPGDKGVVHDTNGNKVGVWEVRA